MKVYVSECVKWEMCWWGGGYYLWACCTHQVEGMYVSRYVCVSSSDGGKGMYVTKVINNVD